MNAEYKTIIGHFYHWESTTPDKVFLRQPKGDTWKTLTYREAGQQARRMATTLAAKGLQKGDHIGILSKNCYHWILADLAIMMGGYVSVPYYASLPKKQLEQVILLSDVKLLFVGKLDSWGDKGDAIPDNVDVIKFPHYDDNAEITVGENWDSLISKHEPTTENFIPNGDDLWTIKFTSGTMGVEVPCIAMGGSISFAESLDTFAKNLQDTQPTMFFAVPRIWTKFYLGVLAKMPQKKLDRMLKIPIVSSIVKKKLRTALGMRDIKIAATGAAITPAFIKDFYKKLGIHLVEAYGMTEVCGSMTNSPDPKSPQDSVGQAIPFGEVKIDPDTDEILMKTPYMMTGYYKNPEKTNEVLIDGWMHSGDRGTIDANGYVRVIGRVKDAFKTSKGSYVTPNPMEEVIMKNDFVEQVCVAGLGIPQPIALLNLSEIGQKASKEEVAKSIQESVIAANQDRAKYEHISTAIIDTELWSVENDILTPTLKVKRSKIDDIYGQKYLSWHEAPDKVVWS